MPARSFIRLYGPTLREAFKILNIMPLGALELIVDCSDGVRGEYDWCFEWVEQKPDYRQFMKLIELLDEYLATTGVMYTIETKIM